MITASRPLAQLERELRKANRACRINSGRASYPAHAARRKALLEEIDQHRDLTPIEQLQAERITTEKYLDLLSSGRKLC